MPVEPTTMHTGLDVRGDLTVRGDLKVEGSFALPADSVNDAQVPVAAKLSASKVRQYYPMHAEQRGSVVDDTIMLGTMPRPGTVTSVRVVVLTKPIGDATCTVDILKNGASILTQVVLIDSGAADRVSIVGTIKSDGSEKYVAGDVFETVVNATIGTGTLPVDLSVAVEGTTDE